MGNHYRLLIETPEANLVEGMKWMMFTFANRFKRFRNSNGHVFQGRFRSIVMEDFERFAWLCHYLSPSNTVYRAQKKVI